MDEHKKTQEWVALDNIWRSIPQNLREQNRDNFKVISELALQCYIRVYGERMYSTQKLYGSEKYTDPEKIL